MATAQRKRIFLAALTIAGIAPMAGATCWQEASASYGIPVPVLAAIAKTESGFNPRAVNVNRDKSVDLGLMQINESHLRALAEYGITRQDLFNPCTNLRVGAWILATIAQRLGWNWEAVGAYNVGCAKLGKKECEVRRASYAWKVHAALRSLHDRSAVSAMPAKAKLLAAAPAQQAPAAATTAVVDYQDATALTRRYAEVRPVPSRAAAPIQVVTLARGTPGVPGGGGADDEVAGASHEVAEVDWYNGDVPAESDDE